MCRQATRGGGYRGALASRELRALLTGQLVSIAGTSLAAVALTVVVFERTTSPLLASLTFALGFLPYVLGGAFASVVDRVQPRRLVTTADAASAALAAVMAWPGIPIRLLLGLLLTLDDLRDVDRRPLLGHRNGTGAASSSPRAGRSRRHRYPFRQAVACRRFTAGRRVVGRGGALLVTCLLERDHPVGGS